MWQDVDFSDCTMKQLNNREVIIYQKDLPNQREIGTYESMVSLITKYV